MEYSIPAEEALFAEFIYAGYLFSSDKSKLQPAVIHHFLDNDSYWAQGIPFDTMLTSIRHSICIGIYAANGEQAGFGRMVTDRATYGYLCDIFVLEAHRGIGLSKELMKVFCHLADEFGLRRFTLTTQTAHDLYRQTGFEVFPHPERLMSRPGVVYKPRS